MWQREDDVIILDREDFGAARLAPQGLIEVLAFGTVTITAGMIGDAQRTTVVAAFDTATEIGQALRQFRDNVQTAATVAAALGPAIAAAARALGLRAEVDVRNEKINYKVREHMHRKVPALLVVGAREVDERSVSVRRLGQKHQTSASLEEALESLRDEVTRRVGVDAANAERAA